MEVHFKPETESRLVELASKSGRATDDLVEDALAGYLAEVAEVREMLDGRYDEIKSGRVKPIDGEAFFDNLRQRLTSLVSGSSSLRATLTQPGASAKTFWTRFAGSSPFHTRATNGQISLHDRFVFGRCATNSSPMHRMKGPCS